LLPSDIEQARVDLLQWSPPIIVDVVTDAYVTALGKAHVSVRALASIQSRLWREMLRGDLGAVAKARKDLLAMAGLAGVAVATVEAVDEAVLEELLDVVACRFGRAPERVRLYNKLLLKASTRLTEMRLAAV
jgi:hypothetical protein